jgi:hypothetical protein
MSAVSVLVMDWTTMGAPPPMLTFPTLTLWDFLRGFMNRILTRSPLSA